MCGRDFCNGAPCGRLTYFCAKYLGDHRQREGWGCAKIFLPEMVVSLVREIFRPTKMGATFIQVNGFYHKLPRNHGKKHVCDFRTLRKILVDLLL